MIGLILAALIVGWSAAPWRRCLCRWLAHRFAWPERGRLQPGMIHFVISMFLE
jgi:hypothetical protein